MGDGLEGRRLTGLLTVKRENFPRMREFGWGGGRAVQRAMLEWGPGEEVRLGLWVLRGGVSVELEGRTAALWRGSPLTRPRLRVSRPSLSLPLRKGGSPRPPFLLPSHPASSSPRSGEGCAEGRLESWRNLLMACAQVLARVSERWNRGRRLARD